MFKTNSSNKNFILSILLILVFIMSTGAILQSNQVDPSSKDEFVTRNQSGEQPTNKNDNVQANSLSKPPK